MSMLILPVFIVLFFILFFFVFLGGAFIFYMFYFRFAKGMRHKKGLHQPAKDVNIFKRLLIDFPRQLALDSYNRDPDYFPDYGFRIIAGKQGCGKTITLVYLLLKYQAEWPRVKIATNMGYALEDAKISHWKDMIDLQNDIYGYVLVLDEVQNWFSSLQSKDFPPGMLTEITQQRKQRKVIYGTSQVFTRVAKPIREQTYLLYEPRTFFGCLTFVKVSEPVLDDTGSVVENKFRKLFFFVQDQKLRDAFDTYKKITKMSEDGFLPRSEQLTASSIDIHPGGSK